MLDKMGFTAIHVQMDVICTRNLKKKIQQPE